MKYFKWYLGAFYYFLISITTSYAIDFKLPSTSFLSENFTYSNQPLLDISLEIKKIPKSRYRSGDDKIFNPVVILASTNSHGTGIILSDKFVNDLRLTNRYPNFKHFIITTLNVVNENSEFSASFVANLFSRDDQLASSLVKILNVDSEKNLALLGVYSKPDYIVGTRFSREPELVIGMNIQAVGHPDDALWTFTRGYVTDLHENFTGQLGSIHISADLIITQTPFFPGAGSPLYDMKGEVIGINCFRSNSLSNLNISISSSDMFDFLESSPSLISSMDPATSLLLNPIDYAQEILRAKLIRKANDEDRILYYLSTLLDGSINLLGVSDSNNKFEFFAVSTNGNFFDMFFHIDHHHSSAYFAVSYDSDGDGISDFEGWDFDGDLTVDYLF